MMSTWGNIQDMHIMDGEIVLAAIGYSDDEYGMPGFTTSFFENPKGHMGELKEYDVAYLLKSEFSK
jgi:hypothetical protein